MTVSQQDGPLLFDTIQTLSAAFTKSERRVARALLGDYPGLGLQTVADLAAASGVSGQTVIRFSVKLGFDSFQAFQQQLINELKQRTAPPLKRFAGKESMEGSPLRAAFDAHQLGLAKTLAQLPGAEFDEATALLCDARRPVLALGGRTSHLMAQYLVLQLQQMRLGTRFVAEHTASRAQALMAVSRKTVVVIYDFRRFSDEAFRFAEAAAKAGAKIILITDPYLSPISKVADIVLPVQIDYLTPFDSQLSAMALTEALVAAMLAKMPSAADQMARYEALRSHLAGSDGAA